MIKIVTRFAIITIPPSIKNIRSARCIYIIRIFSGISRGFSKFCSFFLPPLYLVALLSIPPYTGVFPEQSRLLMLTKKVRGTAAAFLGNTARKRPHRRGQVMFAFYLFISLGICPVYGLNIVLDNRLILKRFLQRDKVRIVINI